MDLTKITPKPVVCRQSTMACALACPRNWWYQYRMGITLRGTQVRESATLGTIYHRLQCLGPGSENTVKAEVSKQQQALMEQVNRGEDIDGQTERLAGMLTTLYNKATVMARVFWERYPQPSYFETIGTEIKHAMELDGLVLEGTMDKLLLSTMGTKGPEIWIRDHKSTGRSLSALFGGMAWSLQARVYRLLAEDYLKGTRVEGLPIRGFILDGITSPGIKLCKTDEKNAKEWNVPVEDAYLRRVKEWYAERGDEVCLSRALFYTEQCVPSELGRALDRMRVLSHTNPAEVGRFDRDATRRECFAYEKQCPYHDLCSTDPAQWDQLFETKYRFEEKEIDDENSEVAV